VRWPSAVALPHLSYRISVLLEESVGLLDLALRIDVFVVLVQIRASSGIIGPSDLSSKKHYVGKVSGRRWHSFLGVLTPRTFTTDRDE
jgi:hypothetical protein